LAIWDDTFQFLGSAACDCNLPPVVSTFTRQVLSLLYDNDSGASGIRSAVKSACAKTLTGREDFVHVLENLYVVATPLVGGARESKIEDFFDAAIKATVVGGKAFDDSNNFDSATHYGKKVFAHSVVRPNANAINFAGFRPLLSNLVSAIRSHAAAAVAAAPAGGAGP